MSFLSSAVNGLNQSETGFQTQQLVSMQNLQDVSNKKYGSVETIIGPVECGPHLFASFDSLDAPLDAKESKALACDAAHRAAQIAAAVSALNGSSEHTLSPAFSELGSTPKIDPVAIFEAVDRLTTEDMAKKVIATLEGHDPDEDINTVIGAAETFAYWKAKHMSPNRKNFLLAEEVNVHNAALILRQHHEKKVTQSGFNQLGEPTGRTDNAAATHFFKNVKKSTLKKVKRNSNLPDGLPFMEYFQNGVRMNVSAEHSVEIVFRAKDRASGIRPEADVYFDQYNAGTVRRILRNKNTAEAGTQVASAPWHKESATQIIREAVDFRRPLNSAYRSSGFLRKLFKG